MSIRDYKITDAQIAEKGVIASPDTLTGTADENKRVFDRLVRECVAPQFNEIVETFADMEESTTEWSGEEAKRQQAEQGRVSAETARASAEDDRAQAESARVSAETARQQTESARDTAETARANAENKRDTAEKSRVSAETGRVNAESARVTAESQRANAESVRAQNESARISAETGRADAEADRVSAEDTRIANENARKSAETDRASAETVRESGENARKSAEKARASAEQQRESAESTRQTNETARVSAEKSRAAAETARQTAENARNVWEEYSASKAYVPGNKVSFNGSSYVCTAATTGHAPTDTAYWLLIAQKGEDGKGAGDMLASVYDPKGKAQDVFQYADAKASAAKSAAAAYTDNKIAAIPTPDVSGQIETHNISENAHADKFAKYLPLSGGTMTGGIKGIKTPTEDTMPTPKSYVDNAVGNLTPSACKVTLTASGWDSTAKTQSATVSGVLEDESKQLIMPMPTGTSMSAYNEAGIQMTAQAANTVTFTADTVPTADVEVWVVVQAVNDVTPPPPPPLDRASWDYISQQSLAGNAKNIWAVGDCKKIKLSGTASKLSLNTELYVYILDFDHDSSTVGGTKDGITFGTFKTALTDGKDVCLMSGFEDDSDFRMNTTNANSGGWKNSDMRYNILGSTNTQNGNATATTATSPKSNTLMSCLPADLRAVMRPMCVYTDNTGGGSDTASYVTTTIDFLPLLAEFEIHGTRTSANSAEKNNQTQYAYFKNGSSKVKYRHDSQYSAMRWWSRSPYSYSSTSFCDMSNSGSADSNYAGNSYGVAPMFKV